MYKRQRRNIPSPDRLVNKRKNKGRFQSRVKDCLQIFITLYKELMINRSEIQDQDFS